MTILRPFAALALLTLGCAAQKPLLYPADHAMHEDAAVQERDIRECPSLANANGPSTARTDAVRETAVGAASCATASLLNRLVRTDHANPTFQAFVNTCLADRGHRVIGWR